MALNPRSVLRLSTRLTLILIVLCGCGMILWLIDTVLQWDVLPDFIDVYVELILVVFAAITGLSILTSIICLLGITGEWIAQRANFDQPDVSRSSKRRVILGSLVAGMLLLSFYIIDEHRKSIKKQDLAASKKLEYIRKSEVLDSALSANLEATMPLWTSYIENIENNRQSLTELLSALESSLPYQPSIKIIKHAETPFKYELLQVNPIKRDTVLERQAMLSLPSTVENKIVEDLFTNSSTEQPFPSDGLFFNSRDPHAWKIVKNGNRRIAILMARID